MKKEFCHICKEGGKQCVEASTTEQVYLEMFHIKCAKCGRLLIE